jgi:hypothetical protein
MATRIIEPPTKTDDRWTFVNALEAMDSDQRLGIYRSGGFTRRECSLWAANYPDEVPLVNNEFEWIALSLADLD